MGAFRAVAEYGPVLGGIKAALITAGAVTALAQVDKGAPTFHAGGPMLAPDEMPIIGRRGEWMVNATGKDTAGEERLRDYNAGIKPNEDRFIPLYIYRQDEQADRYHRDRTARTGGTTTQTAGSVSGHRSSR